ncbi:Spore coat protein Z [Bhargavaea cecembensis DSE10]|uniref:Spore coat protein Z n=1 Tax=Bhargavaea cecembensis DSE10 TaxID=1235279 RepID=M7ND93_9BACL|nr:CotY/CotZ family spore coat protein [Bhargavaea cecembensis]EMR05217.1 Spore coat protein Z [Bhargavaea cecembensis DSE10]
MSCCGKKDFDSSSFDHCLCDVVKAVKHIQDAGTDDYCDDCPTSCFTKPLGGLGSPTAFNTRVINLLTKTGDAFKVHKPMCEKTDSPSYDPPYFTCFRVEKIIGDCCVMLRAVFKDGYTWKSTGLCVTVDIRSFAGIICVADAFVDLCPYD